MKLFMKCLFWAIALFSATNMASAQSRERPRPEAPPDPRPQNPARPHPPKPIFAHPHFGIPNFGPNCFHNRFSPYCDYAYYNGPVFLNGHWVYGGRFPHRYLGGHHQFWYQGSWHDGAWGRGGYWGGRGGYVDGLGR